MNSHEATLYVGAGVLALGAVWYLNRGPKLAAATSGPNSGAATEGGADTSPKLEASSASAPPTRGTWLHTPPTKPHHVSTGGTHHMDRKTHFKIAQANIRDTMSDQSFANSLHTVLAARPMIAGLEESGRNRDHVLGALPHPWRYARPAGGGEPCVYDATRVKLGSPHGIVIAPEENVGHLPGRKDTLPPSIVSVFPFTIIETGQPLKFCVAHLTAEVQRGLGYRKDAAHAKRVNRHRHERAGLHAIAAEDPQHTWMCMDTNFAGMDLPPLVSCWGPNPVGTLGNRTVDYVYAPYHALSVHTKHTLSDHRAVIARY